MIEEIAVKLPKQNVTISSYLRKPGNQWLLCLHGLQTNKNLFLSLLKNLDFDHYSFLCPDFIGFGDSEKSDDFTYDLHQQLETIIELLDHLKIDRVSVVGHSLGGMIATMMLDNIPDRIAALCSVEGNLRIGDCGDSRKSLDVSLDEFETSIYPNLIKFLQASEEPSVETRLQALKITPKKVFYKTSRSIVEYSEKGELFDIFSNSTISRLLVFGQNGSFTSRPSGIGLEIVEISNAGHFILQDAPTQFEQVLSKFLAKQVV